MQPNVRLVPATAGRPAPARPGPQAVEHARGLGLERAA